MRITIEYAHFSKFDTGFVDKCSLSFFYTCIITLLLLDRIICLLCVYICHYIFPFYYLDIYIFFFFCHSDYSVYIIIWSTFSQFEVYCEQLLSDQLFVSLKSMVWIRWIISGYSELLIFSSDWKVFVFVYVVIYKISKPLSQMKQKIDELSSNLCTMCKLI